MIGRRLEMCRLELVPREHGVPLWRRQAIQSSADMGCILEVIVAEMTEAGYSEKDCWRVRLALEEAIVNAHKHGNKGDWTRAIRLRYSVSSCGVTAQVEDEGQGFDPELVPDPLLPENIERPSGRGLFLMRSFLSDICHNEQGNCVCLCQHRPRPK